MQSLGEYNDFFTKTNNALAAKEKICHVLRGLHQKDLEQFGISGKLNYTENMASMPK